MTLLEENYKPNSITTDVFLAELPLPLMKENIKDQFKHPLDINNDYVNIFIDKYSYLFNSLTEDDDEYDDAIEELQELRNEFITFMEKRFYKKLNIGIPNFDELPEEEQNEAIKMIYRYFILNIRKNFANVVVNYILKYKKSIISSLTKTKKKDVTSLSLKKEITSQDDIDIISNLSEIIEIVLDTDIDVSQFIELSESDNNSVEANWINSAYDDIRITGNFVDKYKTMINNEFKYELEIIVRNRIMKKYRLQESI